VTGTDRPRDAQVTRDRLLLAARSRLAAHGYDDVSLREIAADAGVDVALINRYFGSKDDLFLAVLDADAAGIHLLEGDRETFGERVAAAILQETGSGAELEGLMILVRSVGSERGRALSKGARMTGFHKPLVRWLKGEDTARRAFLISALVIGAALMRDINGEALKSGDDLIAARAGLATILQRLSSGEPFLG